MRHALSLRNNHRGPLFNVEISRPVIAGPVGNSAEISLHIISVSKGKRGFVRAAIITSCCCSKLPPACRLRLRLRQLPERANHKSTAAAICRHQDPFPGLLASLTLQVRGSFYGALALLEPRPE